MAPADARETTARAFLRTAKEYHLAARTLQPMSDQVEAPVYVLFTHALELALKAYLRSHGLSAPRGREGHSLSKLLEQCRTQGFHVSIDLRNVVHLLESENSRHDRHK